MNNLFSFATKELSHDAFLCWIINAIKEREYPVADLAKELLNAMTGLSKNTAEEYQNINIYRQHHKIDILVVFTDEEGQHALIIEDKTFSTEHDNQIKRYTDEIEKEIRDGNHKSNNEPCFAANVVLHLCYLKTGYWTDEETFASKNRFDISEKWSYQGINAKRLISILENYRKSHCLIDMFVEYLYDVQSEYRRIEKSIDDSWNSPLSFETMSNAYGQLYLARKLFPKHGCDLKQIPIPEGMPAFSVPVPHFNYVYSGSSRGTPWTQYCFWGEGINQKDWSCLPEDQCTLDKRTPLAHYLFWRIDKDRISLRYYSHYKFDNESYQEKIKNECYGIADSIGQCPKRTASHEFSIIERKYLDFNSHAELSEFVVDTHCKFVSAFNEKHISNPAIGI